MATTAAIERSIRRLLRERGEGKSICPSEVARDVDAEAWRGLMADVRAVAAKLAARGELVVTQRGETVDVETVRGPVRLSLAACRRPRD